MLKALGGSTCFNTLTTSKWYPCRPLRHQPPHDDILPSLGTVAVLLLSGPLIGFKQAQDLYVTSVLLSLQVSYLDSALQPINTCLPASDIVLPCHSITQRRTCLGSLQPSSSKSRPHICTSTACPPGLQALSVTSASQLCREGTHMPFYSFGPSTL